MQQPPSPSQAEPQPEPGSAFSLEEAQVEELERRIETIATLDESEFGEFSRLDWLICIAGSLVIPALVLVWFGR